MHALRRTWKLLAGLGLTAFLIGLTPGSAAALPLPGTKAPFRLFAKAISFINVNRVFLGLNAIGQVGVDSSGRGQTQGGYWPRGTADNYVFNSGLQVAGVVQGAKSSANPWGGDTAGGWFFDGAGGRQQTEAVTPVFQASNPADVANWPADAFVPQGDDVANIYSPPLQGLVSASQGDAHFIAWEGNPAFNIARVHPLGVLVDYRLLAWNYPAGAQDIVFLVATVYNITSANASDYAQHRPGIQPILLAQGQKFQALNNAKFGVQLPLGGYTIGPMFIAAAADNDVGTVGSNYNGAILPFAMEYTYDGPFGNNAAGWKFDPSIFGPPFFAGIGFVGYKYLKGPDGAGAINLATTFCNGNCGGTSGHSDPASTIVNYRLLAGTPAATDGQCNITSPGKTQAQIHFCFMLLGSVGADTRMAESSAPLTLGPGEAKSIVVAYIFAPPVAIPGFTPNGINVDPGNVTWSNSGDSIAAHGGLNRIDSISGFLKYKGPATNSDGTDHIPLQNEFDVVKGSLLGKALVAQALFDTQFLQEFAPDPPQFFLIPGDKQVTILWKPSPTETTGDPFFQIVSSPTKVDATGATIANPLYDPNYRKFDVEGYRIYRGRSDNPSTLKMLVQFDYAGTTFKDFTGAVVIGNCAPELGILTDCPVTFPTPAHPTPLLTAPTAFQTYNIGPQTAFECSGVGSQPPPCTVGGVTADPSLPPTGTPLIFIDQSAGVRVALLGGVTSLATVTDTTVAGSQEGSFPPLADTGVPFIFIDRAGAPGCAGCGVNNGVNYFYSVVAFDVNAPGHGPTSLESAKVTHQVTPQALAPNFNNLATTPQGVFGRHGLLTDNSVPTLDASGRFSKAFPPANGAQVSLAGFAPALIRGSGSVGLTFDSLVITAFSGSTTINQNDYYELTNAAGTTKITVPFAIGNFGTDSSFVSGTFNAFSIDSTLAAPFAGSVLAGSGFNIAASYVIKHNNGGMQGVQHRACANSAPAGGPPGTSCYYNSPRWYSGANETVANPTTQSPANQFSGLTSVATWSNAGTLDGVVTAHHPNGYGVFTGSQFRDVEYAMSPFITAADYKLYWGAAGKVDSVIDVTHDAFVPFSPVVGSSWGILNSNSVAPANGFDARAELTAADFTCIGGLRQYITAQMPACPGPQVALVNTAVPGPVAFAGGPVANLKTVAKQANNGFGIYLHGRIFVFELAGGALPAAGTVWNMRDYTGFIFGGNGEGGNLGTYGFVPAIRPLTEPGTVVQFKFTVANALQTADAGSVSKVHTVPDPYYVTSAFEISIDAKDIQFVNVPVGATIRIYSSSGVLLRVLQNNSTQFNGIVHWDVRNRTNQFVASGVYFYNVEANGNSFTGRMTVVNYASTVQ